MTAWIDDRIQPLKELLDQLLAAPRIHFDDRVRSNLPESHGIYAIALKNSQPGVFLRAGRTVSAAGGLRQRIYGNHFMGTQNGNLRAQLVKDGICSGSQEAKDWIRDNCSVQTVIIDDPQVRGWCEHLMLSVFRPTYGS